MDIICKWLREWLLTIGEVVVGGGMGERAAIFWAPIWGGLKFSEPAFRGGLQFLGAFRRCARSNGFCVTEILSTALKTMAMQVILTELHTQS